MSYSSLTSSKLNNSTPHYIEAALHPPKSSFHRESNFPINDPLNANKRQSSLEQQLSFSQPLKDKSPDEYPLILKEMIMQIEELYNEIQRVAYISEELMNENKIWKEEYQKLKFSLDQNANENYERNFIRRLADLQTLNMKKEEESNKLAIFLKKLENEYNYLKREMEIKNNSSPSSPLLKNDIRNKVADLEAKNNALIKEINGIRGEL